MRGLLPNRNLPVAPPPDGVCDSRSRGRRGDRAGTDRRLGAAGPGRRRAPGARLRRRPGHPGHRAHRRRPGAGERPLAGHRDHPRRGRDAASLVVVAVPLPAVPRVLDELAGAGYTGLVTDVTSVKGPVRSRRPAPAPAPQSPGRFRRRAPDGRPGDLRLRRLRRRTCSTAAPGCSASRPAHRAARLAAARRAGDEPRRAGGAGHGRRARPGRGRDLPRTASAGRRPRALTADDPLAAALGAGSFRDGTRVAATRPELMAAMCGGNAAATRAALDAVLAGAATTRSRRSTAPTRSPRSAVARARLRQPGPPGRRSRASRWTSPPGPTRCCGSAGPAAGSPPSRPTGRRSPWSARPNHPNVGDDRRHQLVRGHVERRVDRAAPPATTSAPSRSSISTRHPSACRGVHRGLRRHHHERDAGAARRRARARTCRSC